MTDIGATVTAVLATSLENLGSYLPKFIGGLIVLIIGLAIATLLKEVVLRFFRFLKVERWFGGVGEWFEGLKNGAAGKRAVWPEILAELVKWAVIILFLIPAVEAWGLPRVTEILNQILLYLPNVFVAVVVGFVGLGIANLIFEIVKSATRDMGSSSSALLANVARYALIFFVSLVVLDQLGVAADLIRILFTGIIAMIALAGGISFGLGGQNTAKVWMDALRARFDSAPQKVRANEIRVKKNAKRGRRR